MKSDKPCRHPERVREFVTSSTDRCGQCGMLHTMIAGRTSVFRRWVQPDDPRVASGAQVTEALLTVARENLKR